MVKKKKKITVHTHGNVTLPRSYSRESGPIHERHSISPIDVTGNE